MIGETYNNDDFGCHARVAQIIRDEISPLLVGQLIDDTEQSWQRMFPVTKPILRDHLLGTMAMGCVDCAIWDAKAKKQDTSVHGLLGSYRKTLPVIAIAGYYEDGKSLSDYATEIDHLKRLGLGGCKMKVGGLSPEEDAERVRVARDAGGANFLLALDANQAWARDDAAKFAGLVEKFDILWLEEPCHWHNDKEDMAYVRQSSSIPICAGQSELTRAGCRDLISARAIDICNIEVTWCGGVTVWDQVAKLAKCSNVKMAHTGDSQFAPHLIGAVSHGTVLEVYHPDRDPFFYKFVTGDAPYRDGMYEIGDVQGWGFSIDDDYIRKLSREF